MHDFEIKKRQILDRVDVLDVVSEQVTLKRRGRRWVGLCPFHTEKTPSFTVSPEMGLFKCFGCGKGGDVFSFVQLRENIPFIEAMRILADRAGVDLGNVSTRSGDGPGRTEIAKVNTWAAGFFCANLKHDCVGRQTREYLGSRQVSDAMVERFGIGLATDGTPGLRDAAGRAGFGQALLLAADLVRQDEHNRLYDTFRNRLIFPIRDVTRRVVGFGGRTLADDRAKYLNTRQNALFDKGRGLYGIELARDAISARRRAIVVEGYTDCIAAHQAGFTETVATLGTALTEAQIDLLRRYCDEVILLFDSDEAGEAAADRAIRVALPRCVAVRLAHLADGKDPSEFLAHAGSEQFSDVLNSAVDALEFKWCQTRDRFDGNVSDAKRREAILDFLRIVADAFGTGAVDEIQRGLLANQVAHVLHIDSGEVHRLLARMQPRRSRRVGDQVREPDQPGKAPRLSQEQAAWITVLEVVLNEPSALQTVGPLPDPESIADESDRRIAGMVVDLARELAEFRLTDVLACCREPADAQRVAELAERGRLRGNYEETLKGAVTRIRGTIADRKVECSKEKLFGVLAKGGAVGEANEHLADVQRGLNEGQRRFHGRRFSRNKLNGADAAREEKTHAAGAEQP